MKRLGPSSTRWLDDRSGKLAYLVVTEGGVAGIGERLRRVDWSIAELDGEQVRLALDARGFTRLPELDKDRLAGAIALSALIVTAELGAADLAWLDGQRRRHFPPERNQLPAHLTMFHALPPSAEAEARTLLATIAARAAAAALVAGLMNLGGGVAYRVVSDDLDRVRDELAVLSTGCSARRTAVAGGRM